jgi:hypothetical protein
MPQPTPCAPLGILVRLSPPSSKQKTIIELTNVIGANKEHVEPNIQCTPMSFFKVTTFASNGIQGPQP